MRFLRQVCPSPIGIRHAPIVAPRAPSASVIGGTTVYLAGQLKCKKGKNPPTGFIILTFVFWRVRVFATAIRCAPTIAPRAPSSFRLCKWGGAIAQLCGLAEMHWLCSYAVCALTSCFAITAIVSAPAITPVHRRKTQRQRRSRRTSTLPKDGENSPTSHKIMPFLLQWVNCACCNLLLDTEAELAALVSCDQDMLLCVQNSHISRTVSRITNGSWTRQQQTKGLGKQLEWRR
jgi:hypothetical protein